MNQKPLKDFYIASQKCNNVNDVCSPLTVEPCNLYVTTMSSYKQLSKTPNIRDIVTIAD